LAIAAGQRLVLQVLPTGAGQFDYACEVDAIAPDDLRDLVRVAIEQHLPVDQIRVLKTAEASERELLHQIAILLVVLHRDYDSLPGSG
jgi:hypothetical protein